MTHDSYRELIQRELDDDLSPEETVVLEAHLLSCTDCRQERAEYQSLALGLSKLSKVMPERSFVSQITQDLLEQVQQPDPFVPTPIGRRLTPTWWRGLSVAAVVVLAVGFSTNWHFGLNAPKTAPTQLASTPDKKALPPATDASSQPVAQAPAGTATPLLTTPASALEVATGSAQITPPVTAAAPSTAPAQPSQQDRSAKSTDSLVVADSGQANGKTVQQSGGTGIAPADTTSDKGVHPTSDNVNPGDDDASVGGTVSPGDDTMGMAATHMITVGSTPAFPNLINQQLQQQVNRGDASVTWATDPYEVVRHLLTELGFASKAIEMTTVDSSRVHVMQNSVLYEVQLEQPFDQGAKGIWRPARIGRGINETNPAGYEKAILQYFDDLVANGTLSGRQEVFVVSHLDAGMISVTLNEQKTLSDGEKSWTDVQYDLTLDQDAAGDWSVKNAKRIG